MARSGIFAAVTPAASTGGRRTTRTRRRRRTRRTRTTRD
jgi:hypothetical protein